MRIQQATDNGNIAALYRSEIAAHRSFNDRSWSTTDNNGDSHYRTASSQFNSNYNTIYDTRESVDSTVNDTLRISNDDVEAVCNEQYRLNLQNDVNFLKSRAVTQAINVEADSIAAFTPSRSESFCAELNVSASAPPYEESAFEYSDTDDMSERNLRPVPRGIVNPNYPGFQHLAHTLQDYCMNVDNNYPSENEMTDDDLDNEITDSTYIPELARYKNVLENKNINNNNEFQSELEKQTTVPPQDYSLTNTISPGRDEIPDLLKTVTKNQNKNINTIDLEITCSATDIENNFHAKDIIGDFNKEIEDEIRTLLNYNINIQDDLEELRKDIKDTFAKPIENTINNISDVVNHVIKKLVETQNVSVDANENTFSEDTDKKMAEEIQDMTLENETNARTEINLSRPTFLLLESNTDSKIPDAFLSDGKDEIIFYENDYDTENMANNVERTIQQLSTELRKIIPKLDEMRDRDRLWVEKKKDSTSITIDRNFNEVANSSVYNNAESNLENDTKVKINYSTHVEASEPKIKVNNRMESRMLRKRQKETSTSSCYRSAQSDTSVRENESARDYDLGSFDVYNIETALPTIDIDAIENHIKAAKAAERRKRNDREEIRKRLAMGVDTEDYYSLGHTDRPGKKPSLHSRLQNGKNLQICFMNETASDNESQSSDLERNLNSSHKNLSQSSIFSKNNFNHPYQTRPLSVNITKQDKLSSSVAKLRTSSLSSKTPKSRSAHSLSHIELKESDFYALQTTLQTEARIALAQAKELARVQMERERRCRAVSPVTEMLRRSMEKASAPLAADRRRVSRQLLTDMNVAQLQVIVNELHSQIEALNEGLVALLMERDELHMGQDSMLVDIEDLTRYLGVKDQAKKIKGTKSGVRRLASFVHK